MRERAGASWQLGLLVGVFGAMAPALAAAQDAAAAVPPATEAGQDAASAPSTDQGAPVEEEFTPDEAIFDYVGVTSKFTEPVIVAPASVSVITREHIDRAGYQSVGEALGDVPGVFVSYDLMNYNVAMRGALGGARAGGRYLKIMIDGVAIPYLQSETYTLGPEFIPMSAIERIEIMRGPASSLYGTGALVGAINIVTKREPFEGEMAAHGSAKVNGGALGQLSGGLDATANLTGRDFYLLLGLQGGGAQRSGKGVWQDSPLKANFMETADPTKQRLSKSDVALPFAFVGRGEYNLLGGLIKANVLGQLTARDAEFHDLSVLTDKTRIQTTNWKGTLAYERPFLQGFTATGRMGLQYGTTLPGDQVRLQLNDPFVVRREASSLGVSGLGEVRYDFTGGGFVLGGADLLFDHEQLPRYVEVPDAGGTERERAKGSAQNLFDVGGYANVNYPLLSWLRLAGGGRVDYHSVYAFAAAARGGAVVALGNRFAVKLLGGTSYKAPSPEQLYTTSMGSGDIYGTQDLNPQYLFGGELSIDYFPLSWLQLSVAGFYNYYMQALAYVSTAGDLLATNYDAHNGGGELLARATYRLPWDVVLEGGFTFSGQYTFVPETVRGGLVEKVVPDNEAVPVLVANSSIGVQFERIFTRARLEYRYVGQRTPSQSNLLKAGTTDMRTPSYTLPDYHLINMLVGTTPIHVAVMDLSASLKLTNLLDWKYAEIGFNGVDVPALGRMVWLQLEARF